MCSVMKQVSILWAREQQNSPTGHIVALFYILVHGFGVYKTQIRGKCEKEHALGRASKANK